MCHPTTQHIDGMSNETECYQEQNNKKDGHQ